MKSNLNLNDLKIVSGKFASKLIGTNRLRRAVKAGWITPAVPGGPYRPAEYVAADLIRLVERIRQEGNPPMLPQEKEALKKFKLKKQQQAGITLVELLGVLTVCIIFITVVIMSFTGVLSGSRQSIAEKNATTLNNAIQQYDQAGGIMTAEIPYQTIKPASIEDLAEAQVFCKLASSSLSGGPFIAAYQSPVISRDPNDFRIIWVSGLNEPAAIIQGATGLRSPAVERGIMTGDLVPGHFQVVGPGLYDGIPEDIPGIVSLSRGDGCTPIMGGGQWGHTPPGNSDGGTTGDADGGGADAGGNDGFFEFDGSGDGTPAGNDDEDDEPEPSPTPVPPGDDDSGTGSGGFIGGDDGGGTPDAGEVAPTPTPTPVPEPDPTPVDPAVGYNVRVWSNLPNKGATSSSSNLGGWIQQLEYAGAVIYWDRTKHPSVQEVLTPVNPWVVGRFLRGVSIDRRQLTADFDLYVIWVENKWLGEVPFAATVWHRPYWLGTMIWADVSSIVDNPATVNISSARWEFDNLRNYQGPVNTILQGSINPGSFGSAGFGGWNGPVSVNIRNTPAPDNLQWTGDDRGILTPSELIGTGMIYVAYGVYVESGGKEAEIPYNQANKPGANNVEYQIFATHKIYDSHKHWFNIE